MIPAIAALLASALRLVHQTVPSSRQPWHCMAGCAVLCLAALTACKPKSEPGQSVTVPLADRDALRIVGSITIRQADLEHHLQQGNRSNATPAEREKALDELVARAQYAQAALDAGLDQDPEVRAQFARILASRLKDRDLVPRLKELAKPVPEERLRQLYQENLGTFRVGESRQVAVLWLNPGKDPARMEQYRGKLAKAREWLQQNQELSKHPEQGFSVLSIDHSEHAPSRYKGGVVGWLTSAGGMDDWSKDLAAIAFSLPQPGDVSDVIEKPSGLFLVRHMATKPAVQRSFESVAPELERAERRRLQQLEEAAFDKAVKDKYPPRLPAR